jgi:hypothetical protein
VVAFEVAQEDAVVRVEEARGTAGETSSDNGVGRNELAARPRNS